ncbi:MAG: hypothetical protein HQL31_00300 [Planctomycetes bacterium]|nr:hypothetical protein [Planctomycetota bacterium]
MSKLAAFPDARQEPFIHIPLRRFGFDPDRPETLPFSPSDISAGSESELQAAVIGHRDHVDLPRSILDSRIFHNLERRSRSGDLPHQGLRDLRRYLDDNADGVWENSWVSFPRSLLSRTASEVLLSDLSADKSDPSKGRRSDEDRFLKMKNGEIHLRVPISYLLKLSLADCLDGIDANALLDKGMRLLDCFLNDNTSPETCSFHLCEAAETTCGQAVAAETERRYLTSQLLMMYANLKFRLQKNGQEGLVFFSPHPPIRQKQLNGCIADTFYRELFMSPCLSGWDCGEAKHEYMELCHQVLSRSHLNAAKKLCEAGILVRNLMVIPNTSNISLANNGTHVSLGSRRLGAMLGDPSSGFTRTHEKYFGDLAIKIFEHFLPLFVGTYSAAPYRIDFNEFHAENLLGFLPHELDYTHLRMIWRRWRKKARNSIFGHVVSPLGPGFLDTAMRRVFWLKGDFVPDFRLLDYPVALMSTENSPSLDGRLGNSERLRRDLHDMGVFDRRMSLYLPVKLREHESMGFTGFESRFYSLFENLEGDMGRAVDLQALITLYSYRCLAADGLEHKDIPDDPVIESERRQILFCAAIGLPTFYIRRDTRNTFLRRILTRTGGTRASHRYAGYLRVPARDYNLALVDLLRSDAADLVEMLGARDLLDDLEQRLRNPGATAQGRITAGVLERAGARSPFSLRSHEFNAAAEAYYREDLRRQQLSAALKSFLNSICALDREGDEEIRRSLNALTAGRDASRLCSELCHRLESGREDEDDLRRLIRFIVMLEHAEALRDHHQNRVKILA